MYSSTCFCQQAQTTQLQLTIYHMYIYIYIYISCVYVYIYIYLYIYVNCTVLDLHSVLSQRHFNFRGQLGSCVFCDCQKVTTRFAPTCRVYIGSGAFWSNCLLQLALVLLLAVLAGLWLVRGLVALRLDHYDACICCSRRS